MSKIFALIRFTFLNVFRNRILWVLLLFGALVLASSILFGLLSQEQELRMLVDLGLAGIEVLTFLVSVFLMVNLILEEMESKTLYLVLTRAVTRTQYLLDKFLGGILSVCSCIFVMTLIHLLILFWKGWNFANEGIYYFSVILMTFEKMFLIASLALFFSLFASSGIVALVFSFFLWTAGHFAMELKFLAGKMEGELLKIFFKVFYYLLPNFQYLNVRDLWVSGSKQLTYFMLYGTLYTLCYSLAFLCLSILLFRKKEF